MWILSVLPETFLHLIFWAGVIITALGFLIDIFPVISRYKLPIQLVGILVMIFGSYLEGGLANEKIWQLRAKELEAANAKIETEVAKKDIKIVEKVVTETKIIKEKGEEVIKYVDREVVKYDTKFIKGGECELPNEFFKAYNDSLEGPKK
jgi:hypothetical protein